MTAWGALKTRLRLKVLDSPLLHSLGQVRKVTPSPTSAQRLRQLRISYELLHGVTMDLQGQLARWSGGSWPRHWNELHLPVGPPPLPSPTEPEKERP